MFAVGYSSCYTYITVYVEYLVNIGQSSEFCDDFSLYYAKTRYI